MQRSWRQDADKLTFIVCRSVSDSKEQVRLSAESDSPVNMVGDINLFLRVDDGEDGDAPPEIVGEIELMIAEKANQRRGFGRAALVTFMEYVIERQTMILEEFVGGVVDSATASKLRAVTGSLSLSCLSVKIGQLNTRSLALFESLSFRKLSAEPNFFGEFELRRAELSLESLDETLRMAGIESYVEVPYERKE